MKGRINRISEKRDKGYWLVDIDSQSYSVWDQDFLSGLKPGDIVDYEWKATGKFRNITSLRKLDPDQGSSDCPDSERDLRIVRMSCLKSASCLLPYLPEDVDRAEYVLSAARKFEDYILNRKGE
jgi:hypothetical protein